jgi:hypothetical protein
MGRPQVRDQGLAGLVLQLLQSRGGDADGQGYSCGEGCAYLCHESNVLYEH